MYRRNSVFWPVGNDKTEAKNVLRALARVQVHEEPSELKLAKESRFARKPNGLEPFILLLNYSLWLRIVGVAPTPPGYEPGVLLLHSTAWSTRVANATSGAVGYDHYIT